MQPSRHALVEEELIASEAWLIGIRWWAGLGVLAATWLTTALFRLSLPAALLYAIGVAILVYNVALRAILNRRLQSVPHVVGHFEALANAQIGPDWLAMALLIHFSTLDLQQVLDRLARGTAEAMGVRGCSIRLLDETGARLTMAAAYGLSDGYVRKGDFGRRCDA